MVAAFGNVPEQERLVRLPVETPSTRIHSTLAEKAIKPARQQIACATTPPDALDYALVEKELSAWKKVDWNGLFPVDQIDDQEVFRSESGQALAANLF